MQHQCSHYERVFSHCSALRNHIKTHINKIDRILEKIAEESTHDVEMINKMTQLTMKAKRCLTLKRMRS
jgi:hypothetical protein